MSLKQELTGDSGSLGVRVQMVYSRPSCSGRCWLTPQTYASLPGRVLGHPKLGPTGASPHGEPASVDLTQGPFVQRGPGRESSWGAVWGDPPSPCFLSGTPARLRLLLPLAPPQTLLTPSSKAALLPEPGMRHFSCFAFFPSLLSCGPDRDLFPA